MKQEKGTWIYTTRVNLHLNAQGVSFSESSKSNVTAVCIWTGDGDGRGIAATDTNTTALFSHFIVPQSTQDLRCMKTKLLTKTPASEPSAPGKPLIIASSVYDDPAFSPDPLSNPLFSSNVPPPWTIPPGPGHPTLKKQRPVNSEDFHPPQPPNSPAVPEPTPAPDNSFIAKPLLSISSSDNNPPTTSPSTSPSTPLASAVTSTSASSASSDPSSSEPHVHPKVDMPHDAHPSTQHPQQPSSSKPESKKRAGFLSRLLGSSPSTDSSDSGTNPSSSSPQMMPNISNNTMLRMKHSTPREAGPRPVLIPQHHPARSAPEVHRSERPVMPPRAKTTATQGAPGKVVPAVVATTVAGRAADDWQARQDLDKIDELDESNPFGSTIHHGGPYEVVSKFVQKDSAPKQQGHPEKTQLARGRNPMMSGDVYRNAQIIALQKGTLGLKPGHILLRDSAAHPETPYAYPHPHPSQLEPQPSRYHNHHNRHAHPQPGASMHEPRTLLERPMPTQMGPSVPQRGSLGNYPEMDAVPPTDPPRTRRRTPSPTAATTHSDEDDDPGLAIGMAMMGGNQNHSHASTDTAPTVVASESDSSSRHSVQKILLREPTDEPSPPYTAHDNYNASPSRTHVLHDYRPQEPAVMQNNYRGEVWETPPITMPRPGPVPPQEPIPQFVPVPAPIPTPSQSRHTSWHPQPIQPPPQQYSRPSRQDIDSLQPQPSQQRVVPVNPGLSRSSTYAPGSLNPYADRSALALSLKAGGGTPKSSSTPSLPGRESDTRSVQQSVMTMSNASSRSQGGENPRRNRYLPKRLIMPAPLQPALQNQATIHQVRFDPQANSVYAPRDPSPPKIKPSSLAPPPRAQDIPMAPSNGKLRKRMSLVGGMKSSKEPSAPPVAAVSFSANIVSADRHARGAERVQKKVLSKRK